MHISILHPETKQNIASDGKKISYQEDYKHVFSYDTIIHCV